MLHSLIPKFKLEKEGRIYVNDDWITNGHWMLRKDAIHRLFKAGYKAYKPLMELLFWKNGKYEDGVFIDDKTPDMLHVIPSPDNYVELNPPKIARIHDNGEVFAYEYESTMQDFKVGIQPGYYPLCKAAQQVKGKGEKFPVTLFAGGDLFGIIMPVRL